MAKTNRGRGASVLSDITTKPGPGGIPTFGESKSLRRCEEALKALLAAPRSRLSYVDPCQVSQHAHPDALAEVIRWYWYNDMEDRRTKFSDIKREFKQIVTHLKPLNKAMEAVSPESRRALNLSLMRTDKIDQAYFDVFGEAERLNMLILEKCQPIVAKKYVKLPETSVANACKSLRLIWEKITGSPLTHNLRIARARATGKLVTDHYEFQTDGMHFVHVLLQAIDPTLTYSKVRSGMKSVFERLPEN